MDERQEVVEIDLSTVTTPPELHAVLARSLGFPLEYVRRQMGHRQITTTIRAYGHLERTLIPDAAARSERALLGESGTKVVPRGSETPPP